MSKIARRSSQDVVVKWGMEMVDLTSLPCPAGWIDVMGLRQRSPSRIDMYYLWLFIFIKHTLLGRYGPRAASTKSKMMSLVV
jgi:hypothetical protein